eukprot:m.43000 g.43000  ORF g.43000 m.43000 type:complete len:267 (-) comp9939_c0_seq1:77-877(-)
MATLRWITSLCHQNYRTTRSARSVGTIWPAFCWKHDDSVSITYCHGTVLKRSFYLSASPRLSDYSYRVRPSCRHFGKVSKPLQDKDTHATPPPPSGPSLGHIAYAGVGCFAAISTLTYIDYAWLPNSFPVLFASFGASTALVFAVPDAPFSQPRSVIGGHVWSAFAGATTVQSSILLSRMFEIDPFPVYIVAPIAVSAAVMGMMGTRTFHPPAGGTALITVMGAAAFQELEYLVTVPAGLGAAWIVLMGVLINNAYPGRKYPTKWW